MSTAGRKCYAGASDQQTTCPAPRCVFPHKDDRGDPDLGFPGQSTGIRAAYPAREAQTLPHKCPIGPQGRVFLHLRRG